MLSVSFLEGEQVKLDRVREFDKEAITSWYKDYDFLRHLDAIPAFPKREEDFTAWVEQKNDRDFTFAVREMKTNKILGFIDLNGVLWNHRTAWLAVAIGEKANRGKGYGREALNLALCYAFHELNLYRLQLTVFDYNHPAMALYEKLGFKKEGTYREFLERDGKRYDMHLYGILRTEWNK
ncbi:GNAT family N-acetyltransferase [Litchfieldia alkalitelluris]|uniref:GNAT family N-acetyltransferase n=1 Tax=Litchfieldia alkalitelluris TaxID=304268 RepID=UPI000997150A|nr:GNAT family protein [Litchfieldia alkalitelluris]